MRYYYRRTVIFALRTRSRNITAKVSWWRVSQNENIHIESWGEIYRVLFGSANVRDLASYRLSGFLYKSEPFRKSIFVTCIIFSPLRILLLFFMPLLAAELTGISGWLLLDLRD